MRALTGFAPTLAESTQSDERSDLDRPEEPKPRNRPRGRSRRALARRRAPRRKGQPGPAHPPLDRRRRARPVRRRLHHPLHTARIRGRSRPDRVCREEVLRSAADRERERREHRRNAREGRSGSAVCRGEAHGRPQAHRRQAVRCPPQGSRRRGRRVSRGAGRTVRNRVEQQARPPRRHPARAAQQRRRKRRRAPAPQAPKAQAGKARRPRRSRRRSREQVGPGSSAAGARRSKILAMGDRPDPLRTGGRPAAFAPGGAP